MVESPTINTTDAVRHGLLLTRCESIMPQQLQLDLAFACSTCANEIEIKVLCSGPGLAADPRTVAAAQLICPCCEQSLQLCFHPTGQVIDVRRTDPPNRRRFSVSLN
jgi:transcription elongation factor Elf1